MKDYPKIGVSKEKAKDIRQKINEAIKIFTYCDKLFNVTFKYKHEKTFTKILKQIVNGSGGIHR